jgi:4-hydroxy-3-methylbut-2-en-1-yl diphosphate synthase IspG/GcpE
VPTRRRSRQISIGGVPVGGDAPVSAQSMTTTVTADVLSALANTAHPQRAVAAEQAVVHSRQCG